MAHKKHRRQTQKVAPTPTREPKTDPDRKVKRKRTPQNDSDRSTSGSSNSSE
jgi:hypothetical protein